MRGCAGEGYCENRWGQLPSKYAIDKQEMVTTRACGGSLGFTTKKDAQRGSVSLHPHSSVFDSLAHPAASTSLGDMELLLSAQLSLGRETTVQWAGK